MTTIPDSWALAVLGANDKEEEIKLQTSQNKLYNNTQYKGNRFYSRRNRFTARRR